MALTNHILMLFWKYWCNQILGILEAIYVIGSKLIVLVKEKDGKHTQYNKSTWYWSLQLCSIQLCGLKIYQLIVFSLCNRINWYSLRLENKEKVPRRLGSRESQSWSPRLLLIIWKLEALLVCLCPQKSQGICLLCSQPVPEGLSLDYVTHFLRNLEWFPCIFHIHITDH